MRTLDDAPTWEPIRKPAVRRFRLKQKPRRKLVRTQQRRQTTTTEDPMTCTHADEIVEADANVYCADCETWLRNEAHPGQDGPPEYGGIDETETGWTGR